MNEALNFAVSCGSGRSAGLGEPFCVPCVCFVSGQTRQGCRARVFILLQMGISATDFGPHIQNQSCLGTNSKERKSYDKKAEMYFYL